MSIVPRNILYWFEWPAAKSRFRTYAYCRCLPIYLGEVSASYRMPPLILCLNIFYLRLGLNRPASTLFKLAVAAGWKLLTKNVSPPSEGIFSVRDTEVYWGWHPMVGLKRLPLTTFAHGLTARLQTIWTIFLILFAITFPPSFYSDSESYISSTPRSSAGVIAHNS